MYGLKKLFLYLALWLYRGMPDIWNRGHIFTARSDESGDRVYLIFNGQRIWVKNPETLRQLGFELGTEKNLSIADLHRYGDGGSIDLTFPKEGKAKKVEDLVQQNVKESVTKHQQSQGGLNYRRSA